MRTGGFVVVGAGCVDGSGAGLELAVVGIPNRIDAPGEYAAFVERGVGEELDGSVESLLGRESHTELFNVGIGPSSVRAGNQAVGGYGHALEQVLHELFVGHTADRLAKALVSAR